MYAHAVSSNGEGHVWTLELVQMQCVDVSVIEEENRHVDRHERPVFQISAFPADLTCKLPFGGTW